MSTPFQTLHHICMVVHDLDRSVGFYESVGVGPWRDYPPLTDYTRLEVPNEDAFLQMKYKVVDLANVQLQLCEPPQVDCPQRRFLDSHGEGVFHLGFERDIAQAQEEAQALGLDVMMKGQRPDDSGFIYFDTLSHTGVVLMARQTPAPR